MSKYKAGRWNSVCDRCGFEFKSDQMKHEWNGLIVCKQCWEPRHELDFLTGIPDDQSVPWTRPEPPDTFNATVTRNNTNGTFQQLVISTPDSSVTVSTSNYTSASSGTAGSIQTGVPDDYGAGIGEMIIGENALDGGFIVR